MIFFLIYIFSLLIVITFLTLIGIDLNQKDKINNNHIVNFVGITFFSIIPIANTILAILLIIFYLNERD